MHKCIVKDRLEIKSGKITKITTAIYKDKSLDVYSEDEDGKALCRNLWRSSYSGYCVAFPGERIYSGNGSVWYYGDSIATLEDWSETKPLSVSEARELTSDELKTITAVHPEFKYVLNKWSGYKTGATVLKALQIWKNNKAFELLIAAGFANLAFNKKVYRLSASNKKILLQQLMHEKNKNITLHEIELCNKYKITAAEYRNYLRESSSYKVSYPLYLYLKKTGNLNYSGVNLYKDYSKLAKKAGHNVKEKYWAFPRNLRDFHNKVLAEVNKIKELQELEKLQEKQSFYTEAVKKFFAFNKNIDGFSIYVPSEVTDIKAQAETLHQCLIRCGYIDKVIRGDCLLVFIKKDGVPIATAEILKNKELGQFYGDELAKDCKPSATTQKALEKWLLSFEKFELKKSA